MTDRFTVRRYSADDAKRVWTVHERALRASPLTFVEDAAVDADITAISEHYLDVGGEFLVGLVDEEIVAVGGFQPRGDRTAKLKRLRVHPSYQRRGYGKRLLERLEARASERGFERIILTTNGRLTAAQRLYEGQGYEETSREIHAETGDEYVSYRKSIGGSDDR